MKVILTAIALLMATVLFAQETDVTKYRAFSTQVSYPDGSKPKTDWIKTNVLIALNLKKGVIVVHAATKYTLDVITYLNQHEGKDGTMFTMKANDQQGRDLTLYLKFFNDTSDGHYATLVLAYPSIEIEYRLTDNE